MSTLKKSDPKFTKAYERLMFRSEMVSLFWAIISERKKQGGFTLQGLAKKIGSTKHEVSRWFNGNSPNWTLNTVASIAHALDVEIRIRAVERSTGRIFTASGSQEAPKTNNVQTSALPYPPVIAMTRVAPGTGQPLYEVRLAGYETTSAAA